MFRMILNPLIATPVPDGLKDKINNMKTNSTLLEDLNNSNNYIEIELTIDASYSAKLKYKKDDFIIFKKDTISPHYLIGKITAIKNNQMLVQFIIETVINQTLNPGVAHNVVKGWKKIANFNFLYDYIVIDKTDIIYPLSLFANIDDNDKKKLEKLFGQYLSKLELTYDKYDISFNDILDINKYDINNDINKYFGKNEYSTSNYSNNTQEIEDYIKKYKECNDLFKIFLNEINFTDNSNDTYFNNISSASELSDIYNLENIINGTSGNANNDAQDKFNNFNEKIKEIKTKPIKLQTSQRININRTKSNPLTRP